MKCLFVVIIWITASVIARAQNRSSKFKAPNADTDKDLVEEWKITDDQLWKYVNDKVPAILDHTGSSTFDEHLKGVQAVLRYWNSPQHLSNAGLFHSIYGTEGFQGFSLPLSERAKIQQLIGTKAENLAYIFCVVDRSTVDETVFGWDEQHSQIDDELISSTYKLRARPELGHFDIQLTKEEWLDFLELTLADWLEQVEGAAKKENALFLWKVGEAYSYRRTAYRKMNEILSKERKDRLAKVPGQMLVSVMSTESASTRHLLQSRTPPVSPCAATALDSLRAMGESIPLDLTPQPMEILYSSVDEF